MVNASFNRITNVSRNEGRNHECAVTTKDSDSGSMGTWESQRTTNNNNKFPFYLKLSIFGILFLALQCFTENNTFGNSFDSEGINTYGVSFDLRTNRNLGESLRKAKDVKETILEEETSSAPRVQEVDDEDDKKKKNKKLAEEMYKKKMEERFKTMSNNRPTHVPGPSHQHNHHLPKLSDQELMQLLRFLPPPPQAMQRRPANQGGSNAGGRLPFESPEQMMQFLRFLNETQNMMGNNACCKLGECDEEEEIEKKSVIKTMISDAFNVVPFLLPAVPPLLMMFIGTQRTYLLLYTLSLVKDAYDILQKMKN
ncbi:Plasmodium exported protein, unknown function [Plasmodium gonderi]|uniref:Uncharacterized protein n=1 Tax=Plasmodium gonderi TaxID=77519 RepID=A0A1Y1JEE7_PLAGO|nr:Plasmodium exported protein, unknown function [Plasmodium gonderi]GAW79587.1 Plasmodium exported protein, unknown function [Plasmodium gonderi]